MTRLTWQQVSAPDFSTALNGVRTASNLLENAGTNISTGLTNFDNAQQDIANQQIAQQVSRYQDPTQLKNALANGIIGSQVDPSRVSAQALNSAQGRVGDLLNTAVNERGLADANYSADRRVITDGRFDIAYDRKEQGREWDIAANEGIRFIQENRTDPKLIRDYIKTLPTDVRTRVIQGLGDSYGKLFGADAALGFSSSMPESIISGEAQKIMAGRPAYEAKPYSDTELTGAGTRNGRPEDAVVGWAGSARPVSQMKIGEVIQHGREVLIPSNKGKFGNPPDKGSSASGAFQITQETLNDFGPDVLGPDWENQPFNFENQEKIAKAIYEKSKNGNLKKRWAGLKNSTPGYYKDIPWEQARADILKGELGNDIYARMEQNGYFGTAAGSAGVPAPAAALAAAARPGGGPVAAPAAVPAVAQAAQPDTSVSRYAGTNAATPGFGFGASVPPGMKLTPIPRVAAKPEVPGQPSTVGSVINNANVSLSKMPGPVGLLGSALQYMTGSGKPTVPVAAAQANQVPPVNANTGTSVVPAANTDTTPAQQLTTAAKGASLIPQDFTGEDFVRLAGRAELGSSERKMANDPYGVAAAYKSNMNDQRPPTQVANEITGKGGVLEGLDTPLVLDVISEVQRATGFNAAAAAALVSQTVERRSPYWSRISLKSRNAGESYVLKDEKLKAAVDLAKSGKITNTVLANEDIDANIQALKNKAAELSKLEQQRTALAARAVEYPDAKAHLAQMDALIKMRTLALNQRFNEFSNIQDFMPKR